MLNTQSQDKAETTSFLVAPLALSTKVIIDPGHVILLKVLGTFHLRIFPSEKKKLNREQPVANDGFELESVKASKLCFEVTQS